MRKRIFSVIFLFSVIILSLFFLLFEKRKPKLEFIEVKRGNVEKDLVESGIVQKDEEINLSFKVSGKIEKIWVNLGEKVKKGDILAKLENSQLKFQLEEAKANLMAVEANFEKLLRGASKEEIKIIEGEVKNAQNSLNLAKESLNFAYQNCLLNFELVPMNISSALKLLESFRDKLIAGSIGTIEVGEAIVKIEKSLFLSQNLLENSRKDSSPENIEKILIEMKKNIQIVSSELERVREVYENSFFYNILSSEIYNIKQQITIINSLSTSLAKTEQEILNLKLNCEIAQTNLQISQDKLAKILSPPREEDIQFYQAQIEQAKLRIQLLENQIEDTILKSPVSGKIVKILKKEGEITQPLISDPVLFILPEENYYIKMDVYEADVIKIKLNDPVEISFSFLPGKVFQGKIISIEPLGKIKEGVIYYEVKIYSENLPAEIKTGMSADIKIKTELKENVLVLPREVIVKKDGDYFVKVLRNGKTEERKIEVGLIGSNDLVEIVSGLEEGEKVSLK